MFKRSFILISMILFIGMQAVADVRLSAHEYLLRGTLVLAGDHAHLVLNPKSREMKVLDLNLLENSKDIKNYKSGVKVEVCVTVAADSRTSNVQANLFKIRPLAPDEALLFYSGEPFGCPENNECFDFGKYIQAPTLGSVIQSSDLSDDFFKCKPGREPGSIKKSISKKH